MQKYLRIFYCVAICLTIGFLSGKITQSSIVSWYPYLKKPFFNPPNWLFAPVWTLLYVFMGIAAGRIWNLWDTRDKQIKNALILFTIQLALNALWSFLFFGLKNPFLALVEIVLLLLFIWECIVAFKKIDKLSSQLFYPYLAWVSFASLLNASIWWLNR
jgi:translocator protein